MTAARTTDRVSTAYARLQRLLDDADPVILDGGIATELERSKAGELRDSDKGL